MPVYYIHAVGVRGHGCCVCLCKKKKKKNTFLSQVHTSKPQELLTKQCKKLYDAWLDLHKDAYGNANLK